MEKDMEKSLRLFKEYLDSPAGKKDIELMKVKHDLQHSRFKKLGKYLKSLSDEQLTELMDKLMTEHDDELSDYWYDKGIMPCLTNKMNFLFEYMFSEKSPAKDVTKKEYKMYGTGFGDAMMKYKGYVFQMFFGQGTVYRINKEGDILFQW